MNKISPNIRSASIYLITAILAAGILCSCGNPPDQTTSHLRVSPADSATRPSGAYVALTLPVLDALFYEEGFEQDLKTKLQLTEEQVQKLKTVSRQSVEELTEEGAANYVGSAREAALRYEQQVREVLGQEKATQLAQLVSQRYAGIDVQDLLPTTPNAVPKDTRILVNIPAYRMDIFQDGRLVKTYTIGIGYPEFPLPTGMRQAETMIFYPTWTPPDEPWVKGKFRPGKKVEAGSKDNPLGLIKIPIGSPSLIHGGKAVAKLGGFASHGCVGMTNEQVVNFALNLALLSGSSLKLEDVENLKQQKGETKSIKLNRPVPVELRYETIVAENGMLRIYRDVYERGTNTVEAARRVLDAHGVAYDSISAQERDTLLQALEEMNRDPQGKQIVADITKDSATIAGIAGDSDSGRKDGVAASKLAGAKQGKVTRNVVGRKEIAVPIARLQGKGYPSPVSLDDGKVPGR